MDKLIRSLSLLKSMDGTALIMSKLKRISISYDLANPSSFEILAWENKKGSKTYRVELPIQYFEEVVSMIPKYKVDRGEIPDPFKEVGKKW